MHCNGSGWLHLVYLKFLWIDGILAKSNYEYYKLFKNIIVFKILVNQRNFKFKNVMN